VVPVQVRVVVQMAAKYARDGYTFDPLKEKKQKEKQASAPNGIQKVTEKKYRIQEKPEPEDEEEDGSDFF